MRIPLILLTLAAPLFFYLRADAQQPNEAVPIKKITPESEQRNLKAADTTIIEKGTPQIDLIDVASRLLHGKEQPRLDSVTAKPQISVIPAVGYTLSTGGSAVISGNVAFRTGPGARVSTVVASASYTEKHQFIMPVQTNFWSADNGYEFVGDYNYLKYPQNTYGLGSGTHISAKAPLNFSLVEVYETVYKHITGDIYAGIGYNFDDHYNISQKNNFNGQASAYSQYGALTSEIGSGFTLNGEIDSRDNAINASKGAYLNIQLRNSTKLLGSTNNWESVIIDARKYFRFPGSSDNVLAFWSYDWLVMAGRPPYLSLPALGWDANLTTGRGYIRGRFRGAQMVYLEGEYRYRITANGLIGGTVFLNGVTFTGRPGTGFQAIEPGFGPGLRIKLNKVSKTNIAINYGLGKQGSKGVFVSVGEAF